MCAGRPIWTMLLVGLLALSGSAWSAAPPLPSGPVKVAALKFDADNTSLNRRTLLQAKLTSVTAGLGASGVDLVVVGEYTFYAGYETTPVKILPDGSGGYTVVSTGSAKSNEIVAGVNETCVWAMTNNTNVALGTLAESVTRAMDPDLPVDTVFNTLMVINRQGKIIGRKRKVTEWFPSNYYQNAIIKQKALDTVATWTLTTQGGMSFVIFPVICAERNDEDMLNKAANFNADLLVKSEREGDCWYEDITQGIQDGAWTPFAPSPAPGGWNWGWTWMMRETFIQKYIVDRDILKPGAWYAVSESGFAYGGLMQLKEPPTPLNGYRKTTDYVYGAIPFDGPAPPANQPPVLNAIGGQNVAEGAALSFAISGSDPDGGTLTYAAMGLPSGASFNASTRTFAWTPGFSQSGTYSVTFTVSDGSLSDSQAVSITVANSNRAPVLDSGPIATPNPARVNESISFFAAGSDPDGGSPVLTWSFGDGDTANGESPVHAYSAPGVYSVTATLTDTGGFSVSASIQVTIGEALTHGRVKVNSAAYALAFGQALKAGPNVDSWSLSGVLNPNDLVESGLDLANLSGHSLSLSFGGSTIVLPAPGAGSTTITWRNPTGVQPVAAATLNPVTGALSISVRGVALAAAFSELGATNVAGVLNRPVAVPLELRLGDWIGTVTLPTRYSNARLNGTGKGVYKLATDGQEERLFFVDRVVLAQTGKAGTFKQRLTATITYLLPKGEALQPNPDGVFVRLGAFVETVGDGSLAGTRFATNATILSYTRPRVGTDGLVLPVTGISSLRITPARHRVQISTNWMASEGGGPFGIAAVLDALNDPRRVAELNIGLECNGFSGEQRVRMVRTGTSWMR